MSALPPITDVGRRIQVCIWLSVYEYTPLASASLPLKPSECFQVFPVQLHKEAVTPNQPSATHQPWLRRLGIFLAAIILLVGGGNLAGRRGAIPLFVIVCRDIAGTALWST